MLTLSVISQHTATFLAMHPNPNPRKNQKTDHSTADTQIREILTESYSTGVHDPRVVLYTKSVRGIALRNPSIPGDTEKFLEFLLKESWKTSPIDTLRLVFYIRDCREGKGEKLIFRAACRWLLETHPVELAYNLRHIPFYGYWKDLLQIFGGTRFQKNVIRIHAAQLQSDLKNLTMCGTTNCKIDIGSAKYAPNEGGMFDKKWGVVSQYMAVLGVSKAEYRKKVLRPLRSARATIVEEQMCARKWDQIEFGKVPSIASLRYKKAFSAHCPEEYAAFLTNVTKGISKMNVSVLTPVDIVRQYTSSRLFRKMCVSVARDATVEAQWAQMIIDRKTRRMQIAKTTGRAPVNALCVIDVSGSMFERKLGVCPIDASISLGLMIACLNDETSPFYKKWITFSNHPKLETLRGDELHEMITCMDQKNWSMNTNFAAVFDLILETATMYSTPRSSMPEMIIVISDMQFDEAGGQLTNWDLVEKKYVAAGYRRPTLVFWEVRGGTVDMPIPHSNVPDCCVMGGFSANLLDPLIDGVVPSPMHLLRKVIDGPRYSRIEIPVTKHVL